MVDIMASLSKYKYQAIAVIIVLGTFVGMGYYIHDLRIQRTALSVKADTLDVQYAQIGKAYQAQGEAYKTELAAKDAAYAAFGNKMVDAMTATDNKLRVLYSAIGEVKSEVKTGAAVSVTPGVGGSFKNETLVQARSGPALTEVTLNYDPSQTLPSKRLTSNWLTYREDFYPVVGEWQAKNGAYTGTIRMTRKVFRPDASGEYTQVGGEEEVPLKTATASFGPSAFGGVQALAPVPRLTLFGGIGRDTEQKKEVPVIGMDYRWTTQLGTGLGIVGNTVFTTVSWRIGN